MAGQIEWIALSVVLVFFFLVTVMGFFDARWKSGPVSEHLDEWGLGGRQFGTWVTWFLVGGDFYTAYTVIAVPALVYAVGAYGFFALPYTIIVYPFVFAVMPRLWQVAKEKDYVTAADVVHGRYGSRALELAVAATGVIATMPYIALQLIGIAAVVKAADQAFQAKGSGGILLGGGQYVAYATLALGSALAAFMYPHTLTGILASQSKNTIRKNAALLPAYTLLLGLIALLGYMGHAAHLKIASPTDMVPALFQSLFPGWFAGFAFAAIGIGALVPAAVMSIGAANLFTRNVWKAYVDPGMDQAREAEVAKITSLVVKFGALLVIVFLPTQFALDLQLLGGVWILQTLPALVFGLFFNWFRAPALLLGWLIGFAAGTVLAWVNGLKPLHALALGHASVTIYIGLLALAANILVAVIANLVWRPTGRRKSPSSTAISSLPRKSG